MEIYKIGVSFGVTFVSNTATGLIGQSALNPYQYQGWFFSGVLLKSIGHGIIFPAIPFKLITEPSNYLCLTKMQVIKLIIILITINTQMNSLYKGRWNLLTTATNLLALYPLSIAYRSHDTITCGLIGGAMSASMISHLVQSHKHGMWGFGINPKVSYALDLIDIVGALALTARVGYMAYKWYLKGNNVSYLLLGLAVCYGAMLISESDHTVATKKRFLLFHNIWHLGIFTLLGIFLSRYY